MAVRPNSATPVVPYATRDALKRIVLPMRLISAAALLLVSSAAALADNNPAFDARTICASIYQPVCASKAGETKTFPNACLAKGAGFTPVSHGGCGEAPELPRFCGGKSCSGK